MVNIEGSQRKALASNMGMAEKAPGTARPEEAIQQQPKMVRAILHYPLLPGHHRSGKLSPTWQGWNFPPHQPNEGWEPEGKSQKNYAIFL